MTEADELRRRMVNELTKKGDLPAGWRESFLAVPRHAFIPDTVWRHDEGIEGPNDLVPLHRADDPDIWLKMAHDNDYIVTQVDDGKPVGPDLIGYMPSSSASMPTVIAIMLNALGLEPGMTVCEIGTGTGYNAALLAHRLGANNVTTLEIDPDLADRARQALTKTEYGSVTVVTGDGAKGYPPRAPFDRIISTANVQWVPYPWVAQTRPGGRIVTPWGTPYYSGGLVSLTVAKDGMARGKIVDKVAFMELRDQRMERVVFRRDVYDQDQAAASSTDIHPYEVAGHYDACIAMGIRVPQCHQLHSPPDEDDPEGILWLVDPTSRSWASVSYIAGNDDVDEYKVRQLGPRKLWNEVETAYHWWVEAGSPTADQWAFTVTPEGQHIGLATSPSIVA